MSGLALKKMFGSSVAVAALVVFAGCAGGGASVHPGLGDMSSTSLKSAESIYNELGGSAGVQALSESFGAKMKLNPSITKFLDASAIDTVEGGLTNTLATLGGQKLPTGSQHLLGTLSGKGLDKTALDGMGTALADAGREKNLASDQVAALESMMVSISKQLLE